MALLSAKQSQTKLLSPVEWNQTIHAVLNSTHAATDEADRVVSESKHLCNVASVQAEEHQKYSTQHLALRAQIVRCLQEELEQTIKCIIHDTELLLDFKHRSEKTLQILSGASNLNATCLDYRSRRPAQDLVQDVVNTELLKEQDNIRQSLTLISRLIQATNQQIRTNKEKKRCLEKDWSNKVEHYDSELLNVKLIQRPAEGRLRAGCLAPRRTLLDESVWKESCHQNITDAKKIMETSTHLRFTIGRLLSEIAIDLREGNENINSHLGKHVNSLDTTCREYEKCREQVLQKIKRLEDTIQTLKEEKAMQVKPMKIVQSRLHNKTTRPLGEIFEESSHSRLRAEVRMLTEFQDACDSKITEAEQARQSLLTMLRELDKDILGKKRSMFIDKEKCLTLRSGFPDSVQLSGF